MSQYLLGIKSRDIIAGDFRFNLLKLLENKLLDIFTGQFQMLNKTTHISGFLIDHVCMNKTLIKEFFTNANVESIYFSDQDYCKNCT